eukprot:scaffold13139_cov121-Isochrysis_galbana.AAC.1
MVQKLRALQQPEVWGLRGWGKCGAMLCPRSPRLPPSGLWMSILVNMAISGWVSQLLPATDRRHRSPGARRSRSDRRQTPRTSPRQYRRRAFRQGTLRHGDRDRGLNLVRVPSLNARAWPSLSGPSAELVRTPGRPILNSPITNGASCAGATRRVESSRRDHKGE